ncbi:MAG: DNA-protecting protein DprA [Bdellovibrionaceae bacterium]|nr:DNA-protecting protein DprA [Pseudobdellovibrionaceae bacterium]
MISLYDFLFFLQKQSFYFRRQDQILTLLTQLTMADPKKILDEIQKIDPDLYQQTCSEVQRNAQFETRSSVNRVRYGEPDYPIEFTFLIDPPLVFSYIGTPVWKREKIAVVGSRQPSQKSIWWLRRELSSLLSLSEFVTVSGGAIGVDQWVHQASVDLKLPTIAILPSGLNQLYPHSFVPLVEPILATGGCVLSEFADDQTVKKHHFCHRNRLIAGLGKVSLIVEAREKSGTLITAHRALEMGKDVFVVPGHPLDDSFKGSLSLLKLGAHIMTAADDVHYWL